ncbi:hypothetical protein [Streptomyces sannanensis]|uniref:hypothetical protein n=1 Tax=Streptomyces sannanensis TaxID=285536 RepID=UPI0031EF9305
MTAAAAAISVLTTGTATAAPAWYNDPNSCTNVKTAAIATVEGRTVEVRYGTCGGAQYGWGRILGYAAADYIRLEVDTTGDRVADDRDYYLANARNYTRGYLSSARLRACFVRSPSGTCTNSNATAWW